MQKELQSAIWQYKIISDYIYAVVNQNRGKTICQHQGFLAEVKQLQSVANNIWKAMDNTKDHVTRTEFLRKAFGTVDKVVINMSTYAQTEGLRSGDVPFKLQEVLPLGWKHHDWNLTTGSKMATVEARCLSFMPTWVDKADQSRRLRCCRCRTLLKNHRVFYFVVAALYLSVFLSFAMSAGNPSAFTAAATSNRPGGYGKPFLNVPPQYKFEESLAQSVGIPTVYGVMHCALLSLGLMPIPMCKGNRYALMNASDQG